MQGEFIELEGADNLEIHIKSRGWGNMKIECERGCLQRGDFPDGPEDTMQPETSLAATRNEGFSFSC